MRGTATVIIPLLVPFLSGEATELAATSWDYSQALRSEHFLEKSTL